MSVWAVGMDLAYFVVAAVLLGLLIDWLAGTRPWGVITMVAIGVVGGMLRFIRDAKALMAPTSARSGRQPGGPTSDSKGPGGSD